MATKRINFEKLEKPIQVQKTQKNNELQSRQNLPSGKNVYKTFNFGKLKWYLISKKLQKPIQMRKKRKQVFRFFRKTNKTMEVRITRKKCSKWETRKQNIYFQEIKKKH